MDLLAIVDRILNPTPSSSPPPEEDAILGLPSSLTGIDLRPIEDRLNRHRAALEEKLGRAVHPVVALLDLFALNAPEASVGSIEDLCLLRKTALRDLIQAALYDNLTGLYSRNILESRLKEEFRRARRYSIPLSVLFIETDGFKSINDTFGHVEGDRVLSFIGRYIRDHVREVDFPARYGGDEFMVLLPHTTGETALALARRIHGEIGSAQKVAGLRTVVTLSIGVGTQLAEMQSEKQLIEAADRATYRAKVRKNMVWPLVNADLHGKTEPAV